MAILGYARVSTQDQHLTGQLEALKAAGAEPIFKEKISGARADRPQLAKLIAALKEGDVVLVTKLDRLGRSTRELLDLIERISKAGASFRSLGRHQHDLAPELEPTQAPRRALERPPSEVALLRRLESGRCKPLSHV